MDYAIFYVMECYVGIRKEQTMWVNMTLFVFLCKY